MLSLGFKSKETYIFYIFSYFKINSHFVKFSNYKKENKNKICVNMVFFILISQIKKRGNQLPLFNV